MFSYSYDLFQIYLRHRHHSPLFISICVQQHIKMRLRFGINSNNALLVVYYATGVLLLSFLQYEDIRRLDRSQKSVFMLRRPNVTSVKAKLYCGIPYDDCRCSVVPAKYCLTDFYLKTSRIITLALFVLQVYLIRELLSLSTDYTFSLVYASWITSLFVLISILFVINRYNCFYKYMALILSFSGFTLFMFVGHEVAHNKHHTRSSHYNNIMVNDQRSESIDISVQ